MKLKRKILIMGLPGAGKTSLAEKLVPRLGAVWFNADAIRQEIHKDLGFSEQDRLEHSRRLGKLSDWAAMGGNFVVADFCCPTESARQAFNPDFVIWVNRIKEGRYQDTNKMFERPDKDSRWCEGDLILEDGTPDEWCEEVLKAIYATEKWDNQAPTALLIGRYQPFHIGHKTLVQESIQRVGQCCVALRDVAGSDKNNPYNFQKVKNEIEKACVEFGDKIKVVELPNITDVFYGRGVGYNIEELELSKEIQGVSATKIRSGQIGQDGKPLGKRPK
jgi:adenylylsulfate kinase